MRDANAGDGQSTEREKHQELRLALSLAGGVSLAVWMGGVTAEIYRFIACRAESPGDPDGRQSAPTAAYRMLLDLTATEVRADVIAGSSAGGINGILLALAQARGVSSQAVTARLRQAMTDVGSFENLLRDPRQSDPPSLLKGDEWVYPRLCEVLKALSDEAPLGGSPTDDSRDGGSGTPIDLQVMTTLLHGHPSEIQDQKATTKIVDLVSAGRFRFQHPGSRGDTGSDFLQPDTPLWLALAARCSSAFPIAFEPSFCPIGEFVPEDRKRRIPARPDMGKFASWNASQDGRSKYTLDAGVLVNKPLEPVLDAIFDMSADRQVRRVFAYVVPDPTTEMANEPDRLDDLPSLMEVAWSSLSTLPRNESISRDIARIADSNRRVTNRRQMVDRFSSEERSKPAPREPGPDNGDEWVLDALTEQGAEEWVVVRQRAESTPEVEADRRQGRDVVVGAAGRLVSPPVVEAAHGLAIELLAEAVKTLPVTDEGMPVAAHLNALRARLHGDIADEIRSIATQTEPDLVGLFDSVIGILSEAVDLMPNVVDLAGTIGFGEEAEAVGRRLRLLATPGGNWLRLVALTASNNTRPGADYTARPDFPIELVLVTKNCDNALGWPAGVETLAGVQMGHFGAFYKRSWRSNDWMWGRLDGLAHLVDIILEPRRLRQTHAGKSTEVLATVGAIATGGTDQELRDWLSKAWEGDKDAIERELEFLDDPDTTTPARLPRTVAAVTRRMQLDILPVEIPLVAQALKADREAGSAISEDARTFEAVWEGNIPPDQGQPRVLKAFLSCKFGQEKWTDGIGASDRFTRLATQAGAIASSMVSSPKTGLGFLSKPLKAIRGTLLSVHWIAKSMILGRGSATSRLGLVAVLASAALLIGLAALDDNPSLWLIAGSIAPAGVAGVWIAMRWHSPDPLLLLLTVIAAVAPFFLTEIATAIGGGPGPEWTHWVENHAPPISLGLLTLGMGLIGSVSGRRSR